MLENAPQTYPSPSEDLQTSSDVYSSIQKINEAVTQCSTWIGPLKYELSKVIVG